MFVLVRSATYAALFIGLVLIYVPARLLSWSGIVRPAAIEEPLVPWSLCGAYSPSQQSEEALLHPSIRLAGW